MAPARAVPSASGRGCEQLQRRSVQCRIPQRVQQVPGAAQRGRARGQDPHEHQRDIGEPAAHGRPCPCAPSATTTRPGRRRSRAAAPARPATRGCRSSGCGKSASSAAEKTTDRAVATAVAATSKPYQLPRIPGRFGRIRGVRRASRHIRWCHHQTPPQTRAPARSRPQPSVRPEARLPSSGEQRGACRDQGRGIHRRKVEAPGRRPGFGRLQQPLGQRSPEQQRQRARNDQEGDRPGQGRGAFGPRQLPGVQEQGQQPRGARGRDGHQGEEEDVKHQASHRGQCARGTLFVRGRHLTSPPCRCRPATARGRNRWPSCPAAGPGRRNPRTPTRPGRRGRGPWFR